MRELLRYKEELALLGILSLVLLLVRWVSATVWPTSGQYDMAAQTETVFWTVLRVVIYALAAWMGLRVVAPKAYKHLKHNVVDQFDTLPEAERGSFSLRMFAILFFGLVFLAMSGCTPAQAAAVAAERTCVAMNAAADVGVREASGRNDGPEVERYLAHVGLGAGHPWCAAFVSYHLDGCGVNNPRSAWSPAFALQKDQVWTPRKAFRSPRPGDVFSVWFGSLGRVGHVGFVTGVQGAYITTVEGNTSGPGSRDGDGVYARRRQLSKLHAITNYIKAEHTGAGADAPAVRTGLGAAAGKLQGAQAHRADRYLVANGSPFRRIAARYPAGRAGKPGGSLTTLAPAGHGPACHHSAQRPVLEYGEHQPGRADACRWMRHGAVRGHAMGPLEAHPAGQHLCAARRAYGGSGAHAEVGVVAAGARSGLCRATRGLIEPQTLLNR